MVRGVDKETSLEEFLSVIRAVEKRPGLYRRYSSLNSPEARFGAWNEVAMETNLPAITCRERWRYARQVFVKFMRKDNVGKSGRNLIKHLHFLKSHIILKKPVATKKRKNKHTKPDTEDVNECVETGELLRNDIAETEAFLDSYSHESSNVLLDNMKVEQTDIDKVTVDEMDSDNENTDELFLKSTLPNKREQSNVQEIFKDDIDLSFLKSMLPEMKLMNHRQKTLFKSKVIDVSIEILYGNDANKDG